ncbi:MAG: 23S rRNA (uracil(1939)-C(5))-methyltransferase RlmD [Defluviitaleaceae bacterium]|nr:23S rRNA (uracil(1939)-C(5))-methyltransferase RlmD [Defluviitaleaceae bacterium]
MKEVKKNTVVPLEIGNVNAKGFGVGRVGDFVLLAEGALPGEKVEARVLKVKARYGYAKVQRVLKPSPHRIKNDCSVSDASRGGSVCGGCQFRHCDYPGQLAIKKQIVVDALTRIAGVEDPPVKDVVGMGSGARVGFAPLKAKSVAESHPRPLGPARYRNKAVFPVVPAGNTDSFAIGMYASRSHRIVEVEDCLIQHPAHINVLAVVKEYMRRNQVAPYDETAHKGMMRQIMVRTSLATGEVMVVLVINGERLPKEKELAETLTTEAGVATVLVNPHTARGNAVLGERFRMLSGSGYIEEKIGEVRYRISAPSFFQVNPVQVKVLYDTALGQLRNNLFRSYREPQAEVTILDAHAGAGGIALYATSCQFDTKLNIIGVDICEAAIVDAKVNAELNGIENARFIAGAAEKIIPDMLSQDGSRVDAVILDPPRRGCEPELLDALTAAKVPQVIYISCDPATLARDIKRLCAGGYGLRKVIPVDMFPHTGHIEAIALLR